MKINHLHIKSRLNVTPAQWVAVLLFAVLCISFVYDYHVMSLEVETELVEGEDHSSEEKSKKEKKEIELIEGMKSALSDGVRSGNNATVSCILKGDYIINIPTPPPELI